MSAAVVGGAAGVAVLAAAVAVADGRRRLTGRRARRRGLAPSSDAGGLLVPHAVRAALARAGIDDHDRAVAAWLGAIGSTALLALVATGGRLLLVLALVAPPVVLHLAGGRLARRRVAQLPDALDAVAAGLRGGLGLAAAVEGAAVVGPPLGPELAAIGREVRAGRPLDEALERWRATHPDAATGLAGASLGVAAAVGGPGARAIDGAAASLRDRLAAEAEGDALATQAKASAALLTAAPLAFTAVLSSLDPATGRFLLGSRVGWACLAGGLALDAAGAAWMAALVRRSR